MILKHQKIREYLELGDQEDLTQYERRELQASLQREISSIWETDELRRYCITFYFCMHILR